MAHKLDSMDIKQIITLAKDGFSNREIARQLGLSRNTINAYRQRFEACQLSFSELLAKSEQELEELFPGHTTINSQRYTDLVGFFPQMNKARNHPGFTFQFHHHVYKQAYPDGYGFTQFMAHYHQLYSKTKGSVKLEHHPGKELYIDFAGKKLHIIDKNTGEVRPVQVFVAVLPNSQYTYVEAVFSQSRQDLIGAMTSMLRFFGGVPKAIVSDNLKSAVSRASKFEPVINRCLKDFAHHYECVINPTRTYAPQDKALVENAVHLVYQRIYHPLREMSFFSLADLNASIWDLLQGYNDQFFTRKESSRRQLFEGIERGYLKELPPTDYQIKDYKRAKVQKMGYVYLSTDKVYYSAPHRYIGEYAMIHYTPTNVEVYVGHTRVATHQRGYRMGSYVTQKDHLSSAHQAYKDWSPPYFIEKAGQHGEHVRAFVAAMFAHQEYPESLYKRAMGVIQLGKGFGSERLNKVCHLALSAGALSYARLKTMLENKVDFRTDFAEEPMTNGTDMPAHANTRGPDYYQ